MTLDEVKTQVNQLLPILRASGVEELLVFGSVARGQANSASDIDFLVQLRDDVGIDGYFRVLFLLEDHLGQPVDLIERRALKERVADRVLSEAIRVA